ncbi:phosphopantetheine-binding protein, partial [Paenibacillus radicis (ex Gao et al. 2016)]|uniref:phosphopantetheine-binding protein n=1 Tax=Paenibacillus radicis (ex Gao et al. 2016) TaxID=1737354 RepID=UPI001E3E037F
HQVKIRGYRIELGEIESQLLKHSDVQQAVVLDKTDTNGHRYLCAYVVAGCPIANPAVELREFLRSVLPGYMIPAAFILLERIPLSPNGKLDRKTLPEPLINDVGPALLQKPRDQVEQEIASLWKALLPGVQTIGADDVFFELGGDSIKLVQLQFWLEERYPGRVSVADLFAYPTVSQLARHINRNGQKKLLGNEITERAFIQRTPDTSVLYRYSFVEGDWIKLQELAANRNLPVYSLLTAVMLYLLYDISESGTVSIQTMNDLPNVIQSCRYTFQGNESDFYKFAAEAEQALSREGIAVEELDAAHAKRDAATLIPLIYRKDKLQKSVNFLYWFDFVLEVQDGHEALELAFHIGSRFHTDAMRAWTDQYLAMIHWLVSEETAHKEATQA